MPNVFNLDFYKDYLISYYFYECDNTEEKRLLRKQVLESRYSDEYLLEIIYNTEEFVLNLLEQEQNSLNGYCHIEMPRDEEYMFTNCTGGYYPDILIPIDIYDESKVVSKHLLKLFLGSKFKIDFDSEENEVYDDEEEDLVIGCIYTIPKLLIVGNFREKYKEVKLEKQEDLVRVLKKKIN